MCRTSRRYLQLWYHSQCWDELKLHELHTEFRISIDLSSEPALSLSPGFTKSDIRRQKTMLVLTVLQSGCLRGGPAERAGLAATLQHSRQTAWKRLAFHHRPASLDTQWEV